MQVGRTREADAVGQEYQITTLLPQLDATANYYTDRPAANAGNDWDVALTVDLPVFDWDRRKAPSMKRAPS